MDIQELKSGGFNWKFTWLYDDEVIIEFNELNKYSNSYWSGTFFYPDNFSCGSRNDLVINGDDWLFEDSKNDNVDVKDLEYVMSIIGDDHISFDRFGKTVEGWAGPTHKDRFLITEWATHEDCEYPCMIALEFYNMDGGEEFIHFLQGKKDD